MATEIMEPDESYKIAPEAMEVVKTYIQCHDTKETALALGCDVQKVSHYLRKPDIKRFLDTLFLEQGYMNQTKIQEVMDNLISKKIEEMEESEMGSNKDILDIMALQHKMRMEIIKAQKEVTTTRVGTQLNVQQNGPQFGTNIDALVSALSGDKT